VVDATSGDAGVDASRGADAGCVESVGWPVTFAGGEVVVVALAARGDDLVAGGAFTGAARFGCTGASAPEGDAFVARLTPAGGLDWVDAFGGARAELFGDVVTRLVLDEDGVVYAGGAHEGAFEFVDEIPSRGEYDPFVVSFGRDGTRRWGRGLLSERWSAVRGLAFVGESLVAAGEWDLVNEPKRESAFHWRLTTDGVAGSPSVVAAELGTVGFNELTPVDDGWCAGGHLFGRLELAGATLETFGSRSAFYCFDAAGDAVGGWTQSGDATAWVLGLAAFADGRLVSVSAVERDRFDLVVAGAGWSAVLETGSALGESLLARVAVDVEDNVYVATSHVGRLEIRGADGELFDVVGRVASRDVVLVSYTAEGEVRWVSAFGGSGDDSAWGLAVDGGHVYVSGAFAETVAFPGGVERTAEGELDGFVVRLDASDGSAAL